MRLELKTIRWQNFLGTGNSWTEIDLCSNKTTLLVGKNGSGKSTLLDALCFVLFNKPFRNITKPKLVNSITRKDCLVEIEFEINGSEFLVRRGVKPNLFEIYKNGELINEDPDVRDYQKEFEKFILKINHQTFCQIVILGSAIFVPFMVLPAAKRREVIEDISNLTIFSEMNKLLKEWMATDEKNLVKAETQQTILENKVEMMEGHIHALSQTHQGEIALKHDQIRKWTQEIAAIQTEIKTLADDIFKNEDEQTEIADPLIKKKKSLEKVQSELEAKVKIVNKEILFLLNNETCPTCKQPLDKNFSAKAIKEKREHIKEVEEALTKLDKQFEAINTKLDDVILLEKKHDELEKLHDEMVSTAKHVSKNIKATHEEIERLTAKVDEIDHEQFEKVKAQLLDVQQIVIDMIDTKVVKDYAAILLKDNGIKAKIIKTFIPVINQLISKYLAALDFFVEFTLDENFNEKILSRYRDEFVYESFSEGEKMRLNLAILFTWRAIARQRSSIDVNLIIFDEILDSSLDTDGISDIINLITTMVDDNILIISHREDQMHDKFDKVLSFKKTRNFSKIVDEKTKVAA